APGGCYSPWTPFLFHRVRSFGAFPAPGGFAAHPPPLRSGGLLLPLDPLLVPQGPLLRSVPCARGIRSSSPSAALRGAATPPGPPSCSTGSAPSERSLRQGDSQLIPLRCAPGGCYSPWTPFLFHRVRSFGAFPAPGGFAAHPPPLRSGGLLLPLDPFLIHRVRSSGVSPLSWCCDCSPTTVSAPRSATPLPGGSAAHPPPLRSGALLLPLDPRGATGGGGSGGMEGGAARRILRMVRVPQAVTSQLSGAPPGGSHGGRGICRCRDMA